MKASQITASVFVVCPLFLSFFAHGAMKAEAYTPLKAEIPVFCQEVADSDLQIYQITILPENEQTPAPASRTLEISENSTGTFEIEITEPGTYRYQISENTGSDSAVTYDERVYEVTVFAENSVSDTLVCAVIANLAGSTEKAEQILFENFAEAVPGSVSTAETTTGTTVTTEPVTTPLTTTEAPPDNPVVSIIHSLKTGDSFPVRALWLGIGAALTAALSAFLFRRRTTDEEGGK